MKIFIRTLYEYWVRNFWLASIIVDENDYFYTWEDCKNIAINKRKGMKDVDLRDI